MVFGLTSARGDRRRRVLTEELISSPASGEESTSAEKRGSRTESSAAPHRYMAAASAENRLRLTDLLPRRLSVLGALFALAVGVVAGLVALDLYRSDLARAMGQSQFDAVRLSDLRGQMTGSLAVWLSSTLLWTASALSLLIFSLRRHRVDDYQARYRIWLWAAAAGVGLSLNTTTGLHRTAVDALLHWTGWRVGETGAIWWVAPTAILMATVGLRVLGEVYDCRTAFVTWLTTFASWIVAIAAHLGWLGLASPEVTTMVVATATLIGNVLLVCGLVLYGRHVVLEVDGLVSPRVSRKSRAESSRTKPSSKRSSPASSGRAKSSAASTTKEKSSRAASPRAKAARVTDLDDDYRERKSRRRVKQWTDGTDGQDEAYDDEPATPQRKLSKSDRKRMRKLKERERRAA